MLTIITLPITYYVFIIQLFFARLRVCGGPAAFLRRVRGGPCPCGGSAALCLRPCGALAASTSQQFAELCNEGPGED
jgi:hypothetical protein